jgi:hypothetical protein
MNVANILWARHKLFKATTKATRQKIKETNAKIWEKKVY